MKILSVISANGDMTSFAIASGPTTTGDQTTYKVSGTVPNPATPPPVTPPVVPGNVVMGVIAQQYKGQPTTITPSQIACFPLPVSDGKYIQLVQAVDTPVATQVEMWFSTTPGDVNDPLRNQTGKNQWGGTGKPCVKTYSYQGGPLYWSTTSGPSTTVGYLPPGPTYYVNFRYTGSTPNQPVTMLLQWN